MRLDAVNVVFIFRTIDKLINQLIQLKLQEKCVVIHSDIDQLEHM